MIKELLDKLLTTNKRMLVFCNLLLILMVDCVIYITGGTAFVFVHIMYVPIIVSAYLFDMTGGAIFACLAGIALGPLMPFNVPLGIMQDPFVWIFRTIFFMLMGSFLGLLFQRIKADEKMQIKKLYEHVTTGYPNSNKLKLDLNDMVHQYDSFSLVTFKIMNLDCIDLYVNYKTGDKAVFKVIESLTEYFGRDNVYSVYTNEMVVTIRECSIEDAYSKAEEVLNLFKEPIYIDGLPISLVIKSGITNFPLHGKGVNHLFTEMGRTLDQEESNQSGICIYENSIAQKNKENYKTVVSLYHAIKYDEFTILYQPKININKNEVMGVEALLRWNHGSNGQISPGEFIKIAEDAGIISEITKWVIKNVIVQLKKWQDEGLTTKVAINISSKDLKDSSIIEYTKNCIQENQIKPTMLEFELTERSIIENENKAEQLLNEIKEFGLKISLDDFGTGYNSLLHLAKLPLDYIKIDKFFMDNIHEIHKPLIGSIIDLTHNMGKEVIAEGVETEEQMNMLNNMGCDNIQGYYFSKPLPKEKIKEYILNFNMYTHFNNCLAVKD